MNIKLAAVAVLASLVLVGCGDNNSAEQKADDKRAYLDAVSTIDIMRDQSIAWQLKFGYVTCRAIDASSVQKVISMADHHEHAYQIGEVVGMSVRYLCPEHLAEAAAYVETH